MHLDEGTLRRSIDEPDSVDAAAREHLDGCAQCRNLRSELEGNASFAQGLFMGDAPAFDPRTRVARAALPRRRPAWLAPGMALAAAACVVLALAFTPLGGIAGQWLTIFEPRQFVPLEISATDSEQLRLVPTLQRLGTWVAPKPPPGQRVTSLSSLGRTLGFEPRQFGDASLGDWRPQPSYVQMPYSASFTFSAAKAKAYEAKFDRSTSADARRSSMAQPTYGNLRPDARTNVCERRRPHRPFNRNEGATAGLHRRELRDRGDLHAHRCPNVPALRSSRQLRAIADPAHTLPIPFVFDKQTATPVTVDGVSGLAIGDESQFGAGVLWTKGGVVYVVAGQMKESEAIALANSVK